VPHHVAFAQLALDWLGIGDNEQNYRTDGAGDRGLDCYRFGNDELELYQFKSQDFITNRTVLDTPVGSNCLSDISRIAGLLSSAGEPHREANRHIKRFLKQLQSAVRTFQQAEDVVDDVATSRQQRTFTITLTLAVLAKDLTPEATQEFQALQQQNEVLKICNVEVLCDIKLLLIDDFLATRWKQQNLSWRDSRGQNDDQIVLHVEEQAINDKTSMIIYSRAIDLIEAYTRFGYQIFEPNVWCEIRNSSVNREIAAQVRTDKGIEDFKYLNNGVTIVCENRSKSGDKIRVKKPGIVNGLQTVTTLASAYDDLSVKLKERFREECQVLVRLYLKHKISVPTLVKATNNQNPMEPRNLRSNDDEQILFERLFADAGWFYERKQFAWEAFTTDEASWPTLRNKTRQNFQFRTGQLGKL
jgi:hypothetical protein